MTPITKNISIDHIVNFTENKSYLKAIKTLNVTTEKIKIKRNMVKNYENMYYQYLMNYSDYHPHLYCFDNYVFPRESVLSKYHVEFSNDFSLFEEL